MAPTMNGLDSAALGSDEIEGLTRLRDPIGQSVEFSTEGARLDRSMSMCCGTVNCPQSTAFWLSP
jgi:hypothetical protein